MPDFGPYLGVNPNSRVALPMEERRGEGQRRGGKNSPSPLPLPSCSPSRIKESVMRKRDLFPGSRLTSQRSLWRYRLYEPPLIEGEGREREDSDGERGRKPPLSPSESSDSLLSPSRKRALSTSWPRNINLVPFRHRNGKYPS